MSEDLIDELLSERARRWIAQDEPPPPDLSRLVAELPAPRRSVWTAVAAVAVCVLAIGGVTLTVTRGTHQSADDQPSPSASTPGPTFRGGPIIGPDVIVKPTRTVSGRSVLGLPVLAVVAHGQSATVTADLTYPEHAETDPRRPRVGEAALVVARPGTFDISGLRADARDRANEIAIGTPITPKRPLKQTLTVVAPATLSSGNYPVFFYFGLGAPNSDRTVTGMIGFITVT
jgi:hypothetical protein